MEDKNIKELLYTTFSRLTLFARDLDLDKNLIKKYQVGQLIQERGFIDCTYLVGGLNRNLRYLICSAYGKDMASFNPKSKETRHALININAQLKVLDIFEIEGKTQITLLQFLPVFKSFFESSNTEAEQRTVENARNFFKEKINAPLQEAQQTEEWIKRTGFPLGMDAKGNFF